MQLHIFRPTRDEVPRGGREEEVSRVEHLRDLEQRERAVSQRLDLEPRHDAVDVDGAAPQEHAVRIDAKRGVACAARRHRRALAARERIAAADGR